MPITLSDIEVPLRAHRRDDYVVDHYCTLCDETVGHDHNFQPEPHKLDECLRELKETIAAMGKNSGSQS